MFTPIREGGGGESIANRVKTHVLIGVTNVPGRDSG